MRASQEHQETLWEHFKNSPYRGQWDSHSPSAFCETPSCGDEVRLFTDSESLAQRCFRKLAFEAEGCVICQAGASLLCCWILEQCQGEFAPARELSQQFRAWIQGGSWPSVLSGSELECLQSTRRFPLRHGCLDLPWKTLEELLSK